MVPQVLWYLTNDKMELFSTMFIHTTLYITLGLLVYWFIFNHVVVFKAKKTPVDDTEKEHLQSYYQSNYIPNTKYT